MDPLDDGYDGKPLKGRGMGGVTSQQRVRCVEIIKKCMLKYPHLKFFTEMPADANLGWLAYYAESVLDGKIDPNKAPEVLPLDLNDFIKYIKSSNQNDVIYGPTEGRIKPHKFFQDLGYKSAIKYGYMKMAYVKQSQELKIEDISGEKTTIISVDNVSKEQENRMKILDDVVGTSEKNEGQKLMLNLFPSLASFHKTPSSTNWLPMISDISKGRNKGYYDDKIWDSYGERLISQARAVMKSSQSGYKLFEKPKASIGEQSLVATIDSFDGLQNVKNVQWNHLISNLKGFTNIVSGTPLEIDELFFYHDAGATTVVPIEVKGIKENLNLSKIFQQFQAFRLKLKYDVELRIFALTETIPASGYSKQIELIEFDVDEKLIDAKEGEMLLKAIGSVKVKKRHSFRIR